MTELPQMVQPMPISQIPQKTQLAQMTDFP